MTREASDDYKLSSCALLLKLEISKKQEINRFAAGGSMLHVCRECYPWIAKSSPYDVVEQAAYQL